MTENKFDKIMITQAEAEKLVREFYEIKADAKPLPGEVDFNLRLTDKDNHTYLLKISSADADEKQIDFQIDMMHHLNNQNLPFEILNQVRLLLQKMILFSYYFFF